MSVLPGHVGDFGHGRCFGIGHRFRSQWHHHGRSISVFSSRKTANTSTTDGGFGHIAHASAAAAAAGDAADNGMVIVAVAVAG